MNNTYKTNVAGRFSFSRRLLAASMLLLALFSFSPLSQADWSVVKGEAERYNRAGKFELALGKAEKALELATRDFGKESTQAADCLNFVGLLYADTGNPALAIDYLEKAVKINTRAFGRNCEVVGINYHNLGYAEKLRERYPQAIRYFEQSVNIFNTIKLYCPTTLNYLGLCYDSNGQYEKAVEALTNAVEESTPINGYAHDVTMIASVNLAQSMSQTGQDTMSFMLLSEATKVYEKHPSLNRGHFALALNNLGYMASKLDMRAKSIESYRRAVALREEVNGPLHPELATCLENLASELEQEGNHAEAEKHYLRALDILQEHEHLTVARKRVENSLEELYSNTRQYTRLRQFRLRLASR